MDNIETILKYQEQTNDRFSTTQLKKHVLYKYHSLVHLTWIILKHIM